MLRVSSRVKLFTNIFVKMILIVILGGCAVSFAMLLIFKPVYRVTMGEKELGIVDSKIAMQDRVNNYLQYGDAENIGYVLLEDSPKYDLRLVKKNISTNEDEIFTAIKESSEVYYKIYAVAVDDVEKYTTDTLESAQKIVDEVNVKQKDYKKKAEITISEKYQKEYTNADIEVAVASIIEPLKAENTKIVEVKVTPAATSTKSVDADILARLKATEVNLAFNAPLQGVITSRYGYRGREFHTGLDLAAPKGTPIAAAEAGVVTCAKWSGNYGYLVKVQHTGGYETYYAHCSKFNVDVGDEVNKGDIVAFVGSTGRSTGPHVHLEIRLNGKTLNPQDFI